jgi:hypothetical protein
MSEAKQLPDINEQTAPQPSEPAVFAAQAAAVTSDESTIPLSGPETSIRRGAFTEKAAAFFLKSVLLAGGFFALGATLTTLILMDLLNHKSGWLKELLQFIKEASKIFVKR